MLIVITTSIEITSIEIEQDKKIQNYSLLSNKINNM